MGGYSRSDLLSFNESQLQSMIDIVEEILAKIQLTKNSYDDYIESQLKPIWTTEQGIQMVSKLQNFSATDVQKFISYINDRIADLNYALGEVKKINVA